MSKNGRLKLFEYSSDFIKISTVDSNNHAHQCKTIDRSNRLSILCQYFELLTKKKFVSNHVKMYQIINEYNRFLIFKHVFLTYAR